MWINQPKSEKKTLPDDIFISKVFLSNEVFIQTQKKTNNADHVNIEDIDKYESLKENKSIY